MEKLDRDGGTKMPVGVFIKTKQVVVAGNEAVDRKKVAMRWVEDNIPGAKALDAFIAPERDRTGALVYNVNYIGG